jgi:hypothetical protein
MLNVGRLEKLVGGRIFAVVSWRIVRKNYELAPMIYETGFDPLRRKNRRTICELEKSSEEFKLALMISRCVRSPDGGRIVGRAKKNAFDPPTAEESSDAPKKMRSIPRRRKNRRTRQKKCVRSPDG